jgi:hypothetical protein
MFEDNHIKPVEIFAGSFIEAGLIKTLLENAEIIAYLTNDTLKPMNSLSFGSNVVRIIISSDDYEKASEIIKGYYQSLGSEK